ncbi:GCN5-related N-acetyltransferase [Prochlorococcus marinus str. MIT 9515]|uniref:GCN5-related N-acetyltransferase n=1 Tax=Prochlorococcus marinus (strain MIT 9515) TaxID=167542 RepID=A2BWW9_PROM5|nr:GNAT family N-acetyltransferase [Prochlorococcus marinus]ABM72280.1 GCN5-related N-acetyltransferase [Prochlorococcus marinus str. MIT 9515]
MNLKQITKKDQLDLKKLYFDSILSIDEKIYNKDQKRVWASQAWDNKIFDSTINAGQGWLINEKKKIIAFAARYPNNKIALLYCKGDHQRRGYGTKLVNKLEKEAKKEGVTFLSTEASLISYKLFLRNNWKIIRKEKIIIKNIIFERYKMIKNLQLINK